MYPDMQELMLDKTIAIIGCGGNGGYVAEFLARFGVKKLLLWDGDTYCESNLNRQVGCTMDTIGQNKAEVMKARVESINPEIECHAKAWFFGEREMDLRQVLECDLIAWEADCCGRKEMAKSYATQAIENGIPVLASPVTENGCQVSIFTKDSLNKFNQEVKNAGFIVGDCPDISQPAYSCAMAACLAVEHIIKYFAFEQCPVINQRLSYDVASDLTHRLDFEYGLLN